MLPPRQCIQGVLRWGCANRVACAGSGTVRIAHASEDVDASSGPPRLATKKLVDAVNSDERARKAVHALAKLLLLFHVDDVFAACRKSIGTLRCG
jgi:hypothetical protein